MATRLFMWCCRRVQRRGSEGSAHSGEGPDGSGDQQGKKSGRRSLFTRPLSSNLPTKKKKKGDKDKTEDGGVGDLSVVRRETEVLRPYQKPPPPKNRARASRVPRALKNHNAAAAAERDIFQELDEADGRENAAPTKPPSTPSKAAAASGGDGSSTEPQPPLSDQPDAAPNTAAAAAAEPGQAPSSAAAADDADEDSQDHLSSSEKDTTPKSSDSELVETAVVEAVPSATEDAESSPASPQKADESLLSLSDVAGDDDDVSVKPEGAEAVPEQTEVDASPKAEEGGEEDCRSEENKDGGCADQKSEDSLTEETKDDASPVPQTKNSVIVEERKGEKDALSGGDEEVDGEGETGVHQDKGDNPEPGTSDAGDATKGDDCRDASSSNTAAEGDVKKVAPRPASYSEYSSSSSTLSVAGKGKRFPVPSVHEDGMDQLMNALQKRLKEDDISLGPADKKGNQKSDSSEPRSAERTGSQSQADQPEDVEGDSAHPTPASED